MNSPPVSSEAVAARGGFPWGTLLRVGGTAVVFSVLFWRIPFGRIGEQILRADLGYFLPALLVTLLFPVFGCARWGAILRAMGHRVSFLRRLQIILGTWPISSVTPSKAGDLLRARPLRDQIPALETMGSVLAERVVDVMVLSGIWLLGAALAGMWKMAGLAGGALMGVAALLMMLGRDPWGMGRSLLGEKLQGLLAAFGALARSPRMLALAVLWSSLNWFLSIVQVKYLLLALGGSIGFAETMASLPPAIFVGLLPFTIAGMGTRDAAILALFAAYAAPHQLLSMSLLYTFLGYWLFALLGLPFTRKVL